MSRTWGIYHFKNINIMAQFLTRANKAVSVSLKALKKALAPNAAYTVRIDILAGITFTLEDIAGTASFLQRNGEDIPGVRKVTLTLFGEKLNALVSVPVDDDGDEDEEFELETANLSLVAMLAPETWSRARADGSEMIVERGTTKLALTVVEDGEESPIDDMLSKDGSKLLKAHSDWPEKVNEAIATFVEKVEEVKSGE